MEKIGINMPSQPIYWTKMAAGDNPNNNYKPPGAKQGLVGAATEFNRSQYNTSGMVYPDDLMSQTNNQYGNNYVIFYINVHEDSFLRKDAGGKISVSGEVQGNIPQRISGAASGLSAGGVTVAAGVAGVAGASGANLGGRAIQATGATPTGAATTVANTVAGAVVAAATITAVGGAKKEYKRQIKAIALHVPTDLSIRYSASWDAEGLAGASAIASAAENLGKAASLNPGTIAQGIAGAVGNVGSYAAGLALQAPGGQLLGKTSGTAANPKKEQLFKEVDFRTFTFSYQFFPKNSTEAANVREIIKEFKLHMHPEFRDAGGFLYIYPSEFDIFYYQNGKENMNIHRHTSCVLTDMNISYTPQGTFSTFSDGMPTQINVQLTFKELALLTKLNIQDGF
jgi:hypothetical protein